MKVSVVMATFNGALYLEEQLRSLAMQSVLPNEIIVSDDCSSDETTTILRKFRSNAAFPVIVAHNQTRCGYAQNFSKAAMMASGDIILFCDQDDIWMPTKIATIIRYFAVHKSKLLVTHNVTVCDNHANVIISDYFAYIRSNSYCRERFVKGCATAIRRELRDAAFPLPSGSNWTHDTRVAAIAHVASARGFLTDILIMHRLHDSNASGYIVSRKNQPARTLACLESRAIENGAIWYFALKQIQPPLQIAVVCEIARTCNLVMRDVPLHEVEQAALLTAKYLNKRQRVRRRNTRLGRMTGIVRLYLTGNYKYIGGSALFACDAARALLRPAKVGTPCIKELQA